jgi:hypothetical protein
MQQNNFILTQSKTRLKSAVKTLTAIITIGLLSACDSTNNNNDDDASLFFYNQLTAFASNTISSVTIDLFDDSDSDALLVNQSYSETASAPRINLELDGTTQNISFTLNRSDNDQPLLVSTNIRLTQDVFYSLIAMGDAAGLLSPPLLIAYERAPSTPLTTQIKLRFIHTLSQLLDGNLTITPIDDEDEILAANLRYTQASSYVLLDDIINDQTVSFDIWLGDNILYTVSCEVEGGNSYDIILAYSAFNEINEVSAFCHKINLV